MAKQRSAPAGVDTTRPNVARIYDHWLGGKDNFPSDREAAEKILAVIPDVRDQCRANREFLRRAVLFLVDAGIRQFIDVGTGLPTQGQVHHVAHEVAPDTRVVYVDNDPVVLAHARALLQDTDKVTVVQADLRDPDKILQQAETRGGIDFDQPFALLLVAIMHYIDDEDAPADLLARFRGAMVPGSYLAVSHVTADHRSEEDRARVLAVYSQATAPMTPRTHAEVTRFFDGFDLVDPGVADVNVWGTQAHDPDDTVIYAAVGRRS